MLSNNTLLDKGRTHKKLQQVSILVAWGPFIINTHVVFPVCENRNVTLPTKKRLPRENFLYRNHKSNHVHYSILKEKESASTLYWAS